ncbi:MAG: hydantoinase/oxoprolinase family protein [Gammaproteobacteria bacterium]|nr:hydantoinase/oxoprolinase family protein [Gammaproteobacteria bacterium]
MRIGVEVGGTFTDLVMFNDGKISVQKVPSTPAEPDRGALDAIRATNISPALIEDLVHGSTVATNAILERKGARVCLVTTQGTRDILYLQRHNRRQIYDLFYRKPQPVVARRDIFEIEERIDAAGRVVTALQLADARDALDAHLAGGDYEAVAICFLNSYANDDHERAVREHISQRFPELAVTCSSEVCREFREYERCSSTTLAAYVQPVIAAYLARLQDHLQHDGFAGRFSIMQSNGGRIPADAMSRNAITSLFSGPAAGVIGAARQALRGGFSELITLDMGGTSTDVCLIENGTPTLIGETEIDGLPIKTPIIDIATVGAGGGSIAWVDDGGLLRVGPHSAGADPGPACYARGGELPTITDAHVLRGTVRPESFLSGEMHVDAHAPEAAFSAIAKQLGVSSIEAADSAIQVAESNIVRAIQRISTERGKDPRDYVLVPFGGAGPMQAVGVAEELGIRQVVVPPAAGVLSAYGLLASDYVYYTSKTQRVTVDDEATGTIRTALSGLAHDAAAYLRKLGLSAQPQFSYTLEMRYAGQAFEIPVELAASAVESLDAQTLIRAFDAAHKRVFEFDKAGAGVCEVISLRVGAAVSPGDLPALTLHEQAPTHHGPLEVFDRGQRFACQVLARTEIAGPLSGPMLVEDGTSTTYVPNGWSVRPDEADNLVITQD